MTRAAFLPRFAQALVTLHAEVLSTYPHVYPTGPMIRVKVRPRREVTLPPLVDPIGAVWLAEHGEFRSVLDSYWLAGRLGFPEIEAVALLQAADKPLDKLVDRSERTWRTELEQVVEGYRASPAYPWR